jgi:hypothetical protein
MTTTLKVTTAIAAILIAVPLLIVKRIPDLNTVPVATSSVSQTTTVKSIVDDYTKGQERALQNATTNLVLTPSRITPDLTGVRVLWQIENKSDVQYQMVNWECAVFYNSEPVNAELLWAQRIPAKGRVFVERSYDFHEIDYNASKTVSPSAFKFECRMTWANDGSF